MTQDKRNLDELITNGFTDKFRVNIFAGKNRVGGFSCKTLYDLKLAIELHKQQTTKKRRYEIIER